jgi:(p)ppGpp synthase/HD superfamily hydrolase
MEIQPQVTKALVLATKAHKGQTRKYTHEPYINHPVAVARILANLQCSDDMLCAALLHDVVEDTEYTIEAVVIATNAEVARLVMELTSIHSEEFRANRAERKQLEAHRLSFASADAQTIKVADLIDNTRTIVAHDPEFAKVYLAEKEELLNNSLTAASPLLVHQAKQQIASARFFIPNEKEAVDANSSS